MTKTIRWEDIDPDYRPDVLVNDVSAVLARVTERCYLKLPKDFRGILVKR